MPVLPKEVVQNIIDLMPIKESVLVRWTVLVQEAMHFESLFQHMLHLYRMSRRYPDYHLVMDILPGPLGDWYE
jgi:hypothetical protein